MSLNKKHKAFADTYLKDPQRNARKAYKEVYPKVKDNTADVNASRLLKNAKVKEYIDSIEKQTTQQVGIEVSEIYSGYRSLIDTCGKKVEKKVGKKKVEVLVDAHNMKGALDSLARIKGLFTDNLNITGLTLAKAIQKRKEELADSPKS